MTSSPEQVDPNAAPSILNPYRVTLRGVTPHLGDRVLGTGGEPVAGEVIDVAALGDETTVTLRVVPLPELLPELSIDETFDLGNAMIEVPDAIAQLYDVQRSGASLTFTPNERFVDLVESAGGVVPQHALLPVVPGPMAGAFGADELAAELVRQGLDIELPAQAPFSQCKGSISTMPIQLAAPPLFSVELIPSLTVLYTPEDQLRTWMLNLDATGKVDIGLKATAAFEGKIACEATLYTIQIPVGGPLSIFLAGLVPVKAGVEVAGKVTVASLEVGASVTAKTRGRLGILCLSPAGCALSHELADVTVDMKPRVDGPALQDLRLEPSLEASISIEGAVGSPILSALRLDLAKAKVGAKLGGDWAPRALQIRDAAYAASYKLGLEGGVSVGAGLGDIASMLGLSSLTGAELKLSGDLAKSPTGTVTTDKANYAAGDNATAIVELAPADVAFLGVYNVKEVLLVRSSAGTITGLDAVDASPGQTRFELSFTAPAQMAATEVYGFLVTTLVPADAFQLELARATTTPPILFISNRGGRVDLYTVSPDGGEATPVTSDAPQDTWPAWSPDHSRLLVVREGSQGSGIYVMNRDGSGAQLLRKGANLPAWSPDGTKIAFATQGPAIEGLVYTELWVMNADGSGARSLTPGLKSTNTLPTWSPDSTRIAFVSDRVGVRHEIYVIRVDGSGTERLTNDGGYQPSWSPDGAALAFQCGRNGRPHICIQQVNGSGTTLIDTAPILAGDPVWSPDGKRLAFSGSAAGNEDIYVINADGSGLVRLTDDPAADQMPNW